MSRGSAPATVVASILCLAACEVARGQAPLKLGGEFAVNTYTAGDQYDPAVARRRRGLRRRLDQPRTGRRRHGVYARRFSAAGAPQGGEFRVNTHTAAAQSRPDRGDGRRRRLRRRLEQLRPGRQHRRHLRPALQRRRRRRRAASSASTPHHELRNGSGAWRWTPTATSSSPGRATARTAAATASTPGASTRRALRRAPSSASTPTPRASEGLPAVGDGRRRRLRRRLASPTRTDRAIGVFAQRYSAAGAPAGRRVPGQHLPTTAHSVPSPPWQWTPTATSSSPGRATARTARATASTPSATRRGRAAGRRVPRQHLHDRRPGRRPRWRWTPTATSSSPGRARPGRLRRRRLRPAATTRQASRRAASSASTPHHRPARPSRRWRWTPTATSSSPGQSDLQDGFGAGVFAQRFDVPTVIDIDGDGQYLPLTDGLLLLRFGFGFNGATLVTGA